MLEHIAFTGNQKALSSFGLISRKEMQEISGYFQISLRCK
jgi:hypothetical protein